ncbi:uncharacterized protein MYCFIDRAFT_193778 [Pseudocercospora fijiensis CIRAD86]|uniref:Uncharacterized protein n=1 Tax=Pseudocercospora fijiensis (strain CIRAD86) TaxID=383855 RepID=M3B834_PSEFD|nr:uncharacterized protein MYCFIDRAFT_193778 [Pseudocercospora fijiensis CIRAD86]EME85482.1 hypothetical protein MYCFIDRAFT_193778 [Pseudocercospora fijiensis CIRAD86]
MADRHAIESYEHELLADVAKYGHDFLINEEVADHDELLYEQQEDRADIDQDESSGADALDSVSTPSPRTTAKSAQASLFRLPILLQLMRNVFMNNGEQEHLNWNHTKPILEDSSEPAIYKSALEDLTTIAENLTRRLVQAAIFQAMTRLRAGDSSRSDWTPLAAIREVDVHQAVDLLGMKPEWHRYWADVVERNRLAVYSDSKRYQDGRPGKKFGYRLTSKEVRRELVDELDVTSECSDHENTNVFAEDIAEFMEDSDLFTEDDAHSDHTSEADNGSDSEPGSPRPGSRKRKRALSPGEFARAEDNYLEAMDQSSSRQGELLLWRSLRLDPHQELLNQKPYDQQAPRARTEPSKANSWRDTVEYVDDWELGVGVPKESHFLTMGREGRRGMPKPGNRARVPTASIFSLIHTVCTASGSIADTVKAKARARVMVVARIALVARSLVAARSVVDQSVVDQSVVDQSVVDQSVVDQSVVDQSVVDQSVVVDRWWSWLAAGIRLALFEISF